MIADPRFQRWVSSVPGLRRIADKRIKNLFALSGGFIYSQVLYTCVRLELFDYLCDEPKTPDALAQHCRLDSEAATRLIRAAVSLDLMEDVGDGRITLGELGAAMVGNPAVGDMVRHHAMLYADLADPVGLLRGERAETALGAYWGYAKTDEPDAADADTVRDYTKLMSASQSFIAEDVLDAFSLRNKRCLLDVGGGNGTFIGEVAKRYPDLGLKLFDLPAVAVEARARLGDRPVDIQGGNFFKDHLPLGADVISLVRIIHDHDDADVMVLLRKVHEALPSGGMLLLAEPMAGEKADDPIAEAYFGFYLLAMGSGRPRSVLELTAMLNAAGFSEIREISTRRPLLTRLLCASRP